MPSYRGPREIASLPLTLLRSNKRPDDPQMAQAVQDHAANTQLPEYMPQSMAFSRWKTPPVKVAPGQNAVSVLSALEIQHLHLQLIKKNFYNPPAQSAVQAADELAARRLPQPSDNLDPNLNTRPIARGVIPASNFVTGGELNSFAQNRLAQITQLRDNAQVGRAQALSEALALRDHLQALITENT